MNRTKRTRITAFLLALACLVSLFPITALSADAPESTISLRAITWSSTTYQSDYFSRQCQIQHFQMNVGRQTLSGFCGDHSLHLNNQHIGDTWSTPQEVTDNVVKTMMAYYYTHLLGEEYYNDACIAKGFNYQLSEENLLLVNGWIQEVVWLWSTDQIPSDHDGQVEIVAQAFRESSNARLGTSYDSIDSPTSPDSPNTFRSVTETVLSNPECWCDCPVYRYVHPDSDVQPILVGYPKKATTITVDYEIAVKKVDSSNPTNTLSGATFRLESITDNSFQPKTVTTNSAGIGTFNRLPAGTYTVTEIAAPSGYQIDNSSPVYVTLPNNGEDTVTVTFTDTPTTTVSGTIRKVDKDNPTRGLAGATIAVQGIDNAFYGEFQTGAGGALEGLNWSELLPGNYRAWEVSAPEGYILDASDVKTFTVSRTHPDVKLVFMDDSKVKVLLQKTDDSNHPLPGAVFNVLKDGQIIATEATDSAGKITVTGITEGFYSFVEVSAPAGYAKLDEPIGVHVDHAAIEGGGTITVTASDKKLPDLTIQKRDAGTGAAVPGTVFDVRGIGNGYHEEVTTGSNGDAVLTGIPTGSYEVTEKSVPEPYVLGEDRTQTVWLEGGAQRSLVFTNEKKPTLNLLKIDALTSAPVPGTVFTVRGVGSSYRSDWTTGTDGTVSETLNPGTYQVTEKSVPAPYYLPELAADRVQTIRLNAGDEKELVFRDYKEPEITIYKVDSVTRAPIEGAQFHVTYTSNGTSAEAPATYDFGTVYTDARGEILLHKDGIRLYPGEYTITETAPAPGFQMKEPTTQTIILNGGESKSVTFHNEPLNAIAVEKYDSVTGRPLEGATFRLRYLSGTSGTGGTIIGTKTTGANGSAIWTGLEAGTYIVEEVSAPPGYNILQISETVHIANNG